MRRTLIVVLALVAGVGGAVLAIRAQRDADTGRVAVVFDTAKGIVPGQLVKIAGARAGRVEDVALTADNRARLQLRVEKRFLPFHADATCRILPEGPISENSVECDPGVAATRSLRAVDGVPTVPVTQTTAPVSIQDLLNVFAAPTPTRLRLLLNELGIATAGRGDDINDILRRTNPTLRQAQALLRVVNDQRAQLGRTIDQTDTVLADLGSSDADVRRFVASSAATLRTTGQHRAALAGAVQRLPAVLGAARSGLRSIDRATAAGTPLLASLERSGPGLTAMTTNLRSFAAAGQPAVRSAASAAAEGRRAVRPLRKLGRSLKALGATAPTVATLRDFMVASRDKGAIEYLLRVPYALGTMTSLYNGVSHVVSLFVGMQIKCLIPGVTAPGCDQRYFGPRKPINDPSGIAATRTILRDALAKLTAATKSRPRRPGKQVPTKPQHRQPDSPPQRDPAAVVKRVPEAVQKILDGLGQLLQPPSRKRGGSARNDLTTGLLDYLLK
jgi:virulence factor Mce-like protein